MDADSADFVAYDDRSLARGDTWLARLQARGGTEMLAPLKEALGGGATPDGRIRTVLFVTDGQAHNCLLYTSPSPRDRTRSRMPSSA